MADLSILAGATSQSILVDLYVLATGAAQTGLVYNSSGLTAYYSFVGANSGAAAITLATQTTGTAWATGGFVKLSDTNMPGVYNFDVPNAVFAASKGREVWITFTGFSGMATRTIKIELTGWDNQDAVHGGISALPNTACTTNASLLTSGTGIAQINTDGSGRVNLGKILDTAVSTPATAGILDVNVKNMNNVAATAITTVKAVQGLTTADTIATYTGNTVQTGDTYARLGAPAGASVSADVAAVNAKTTNLPASPASTTNITGGTITTVTNLTNAPTAGDLTVAMKASVTTAATAATPTAAAVTGAVGSVTAAVSVTGDFSSTMKTSLNASTPASVQNINAQTGDAYIAANAVGTSLAADLVTIDNNIAGVSSQVSGLNNLSSAQVTTAAAAATAVPMTESYAAQGADLTPAQALYQIVQQAGQMSITGTTMTVLKRDEATTAKTFTLNSSTAPTAITETT